MVEIDEAYVKAGLKERNNQGKIKVLGRKARERGLKRRGRGNYAKDCMQKEKGMLTHVSVSFH